MFLLHFTVNLFAITFVERADQDAKSKIGWDEFQAPRYRDWLGASPSSYHDASMPHHSNQDTVNIRFAVPQNSLQQFQVGVWSNRSIFNTRLFLRAVMDLPQLSADKTAK